MRWLGHKRFRRDQLEQVHKKLEQETERDRRVAEVTARLERARQRNNFGESIEIAMGRRRNA